MYNQLKDCNIEFYDYIIEINLNIPIKAFWHLRIWLFK